MAFWLLMQTRAIFFELFAACFWQKLLSSTPVPVPSWPTDASRRRRRERRGEEEATQGSGAVHGAG